MTDVDALIARLEAEHGHEQIAAWINAPDDAPEELVLLCIIRCARSWVPEARIIGNVRAGDIARVCETALRARSTTP